METDHFIDSGGAGDFCVISDEKQSSTYGMGGSGMEERHGGMEAWMDTGGKGCGMEERHAAPVAAPVAAADTAVTGNLEITADLEEEDDLAFFLTGANYEVALRFRIGSTLTQPCETGKHIMLGYKTDQDAAADFVRYIVSRGGGEIVTCVEQAHVVIESHK